MKSSPSTTKLAVLKIYKERRPHRGVIFLRLEDERAGNKRETLRRLLEAYADRLTDNFVVVTESRVRFARVVR